jgi:hypothetical protein
MNKKALGIFVSLLAIAISLPLGAVSAAKPIEIATVSQTEFITFTSTPVGKNEIVVAPQDGAFISGDFLGISIIYREVRVVWHYGNVEKWGAPFSNIQNIFECSGSFTLASVLYEGEFTIKMMGQAGKHVTWVIINSDLTADGEPVNMQGQGTSTLQIVPNPDPNPGMPPIFIQNTFEGQISFTPA